MNIFVLNTGRCGSTTFIKACRHIKNYTCAHESRTAMLGEDRLNYPENHIEADNRLSWLLGRLDKSYGDNAFYVHLKRNREGTAQSFTRRYASGIIKAYRGDGILMDLPEDAEPMDVSADYCDTVNSNIALFLKDKTKKIEVSLENIEKDFKVFWDSIGAEGEINDALSELRTSYNASKQKQEKKSDNIVSRILCKLKRLIVKFPGYIKDA